MTEWFGRIAENKTNTETGKGPLGEGKRFKALEPVLDEHAEWFGRIMRCTFYPDDPRSGPTISDPGSFQPWLKDAARDDTYDPSIIARMEGLYHELCAASHTLVEATAGGVRPPIALMDNFIDLYDELFHQLRRMERDSAMVDSGIDATTGLRSRENMIFDLERELERRARRGRPFCIAFARIDQYAQFIETQGKEQAFLLIKQAADAIQEVLRTYDDAYRLDQGEFVFSLKHSDITGGLRAVERLRLCLAERKAPFTMSFVVAEPVPGDDVKSMISQSRRDLDATRDKPDVALRYKEVSALARFAQEDSPVLSQLKNEDDAS